MSNRLECDLSFLLPFNSSIFNRFLEGGDLVIESALMFPHGFTGLAGADDDFFGVFRLGDAVNPGEIFELLRVMLLLLDLVEILGENEVGLFKADLGLLIVTWLFRIPFSKDFLAESKACLRSIFCCAEDVLSLTFTIFAVCQFVK
jgi:hypothetical protein